MEVKIDNLEDMCALMCDNVIPVHCEIDDFDNKLCLKCKYYEDSWDSIPCDGCTNRHSNFVPSEKIEEEEAE